MGKVGAKKSVADFDGAVARALANDGRIDADELGRILGEARDAQRRSGAPQQTRTLLAGRIAAWEASGYIDDGAVAARVAHATGRLGSKAYAGAAPYAAYDAFFDETRRTRGDSAFNDADVIAAAVRIAVESVRDSLDPLAARAILANRLEALVENGFVYTQTGKAHVRRGVAAVAGLQLFKPHQIRSGDPSTSTGPRQLAARARALGLDVLPAVLALDDGAVLPDRLIAKKNSRVIAESMVARLFLRHEDPKVKAVDAPHCNLMKDTAIHLYFDSERAEQIGKHGFLNLFQSGTSNGNELPESRDEIEKEMIRLRVDAFYDRDNAPSIGDKRNQLRPKYATLFFNDPSHAAGADNCAVLRKYGDFVAVLKDNVKKRSTWATYDTLKGTRPDGERPRTFYHRSAAPIPAREFYEVEVWGRLGVGDVAAFLVPKATRRDAAGLAARVVALKRLGVPIYEYEERRRGGSVQRVRGKLLFTP